MNQRVRVYVCGCVSTGDPTVHPSGAGTPVRIDSILLGHGRD